MAVALRGGGATGPADSKNHSGRLEVDGDRSAEDGSGRVGISGDELAASAPAVGRYYNGRADCENVSKELQAGLALPILCLEQFWASEAALGLARLTCNLTGLFEWHLGWQHKVTLRNLRYWRFVTTGVWSHRWARRRSNWPCRGGNATGGDAHGKRPKPDPQLQCSRKPSRFHHPIHMTNQFLLHGFG